MVVDFPVPAAPTSTSSRRPEVTTAATAEACSAESTWALPGTVMGPSLATTEGAQPARRRLGRRPAAALRRRGALGWRRPRCCGAQHARPVRALQVLRSTRDHSGVSMTARCAASVATCSATVTRSLAAVNRTPWSSRWASARRFARVTWPACPHLGQHNGGSIPQNPLLQVARGQQPLPMPAAQRPDPLGLVAVDEPARPGAPLANELGQRLDVLRVAGGRVACCRIRSLRRP